LALPYISAFFTPLMVFSIFTPHLLYWLKHVDASWNYSASLLNFVGSDMAAYIRVNIGVRGMQGGAH